MIRQPALAMALLVLTLAGLFAALPADVAAQSMTTGALGGTVLGPDRRPSSGVQVTIRRLEGGLERSVVTDASGRFLVETLEPGDYELVAERLGFRPTLLTPIPVLPGRRLDVRAWLRPAEGVVTAPDSVVFWGAGLAAASLAGQTQRFGDWALRYVPQRDGSLTDLLRLSSLGEAPLEAEGLPASLGKLAVAGLPYDPVGLGDGRGGLQATLAFPALAAGGVELMAGAPDIEWPGAAGSLLAAWRRPVGGGVDGEVEGLWGGLDALGDAEQHHLEAPQTLRGRAFFGGSMAGDSARAFGFVEAQQQSVPVRYWGASTLAVLADAGLDLSELDSDLGDTERVSVGGSFDWRFAGGQSIEVLAAFGRAEADHGVSSLYGAPVPATVEGDDLLTVATATTRLSEQLGLEINLGFSRSSRDYAGRDALNTGLGDGALLFPTLNTQVREPSHAAELQRSALSAQGTLHFRTGDHHLKGGLGGRLISHDRTLEDAGVYLFGGAASFADRNGVFRRLEGSATTASFGVTEFFVYGQDVWRAAPGLDLTSAVRWEIETVPSSDILANRRWRELTGIDNADAPGTTADIELLAGFDWNVQEQHVWGVRGGLSIRRGDVPPELLTEALTHDGRLEATTILGDLAAPATELGPRLAILSPGLKAPSTTRVSMGLSRALGNTAVIQLGGVFRLTDNLPARTDLNLPATAPFEDQHGRPVYGRLTRVGGLLVPEPGSNRRFGEFDAVAAITSEASSTYWGLTAGIEKRLGLLKALASYTFSHTEDDWLGAGTLAGPGSPRALPPFPGSDELDGWTEGTSDLDVPHRAVLAAELAMPFARAVSLGATWSHASGRPFTPGYGRGIDINADGVAGNDPAFVDDALEGMDAVQTRWSCLRSFSGRLVERNACRAPARTMLDAWLAIRLPLQGVMPELRIEALALDHEGLELLDTALYRLDTAGEVVIDPESGVVTVPLRVNPRFGSAFYPATEISRLRVGFTMRF